MGLLTYFLEKLAWFVAMYISDKDKTVGACLHAYIRSKVSSVSPLISCLHIGHWRPQSSLE